MLYEVVLDQRFFNQQCINRWNYVNTGSASGVSNSLALLNALGFIADGSGDFPADGLFSQIGSLVANEVQFIQVTCRAIYDVNDFYAYAFPTGTTGSAGSAGAVAPFDAYGFRTNRIRQDIARGTKRFVGVTEGAINTGGVINTAGLLLMDEVADAMSASVGFPLVSPEVTFTPVIVGKEKYETPSGKFAYRYYETLVSQNAHLASNPVWENYLTMRSQTSRQYGKGS